MSAGSKPTKGVPILFEIIEKGISDPVRGPFRTRTIVGCHPGNGAKRGGCCVDKARRVEGSGKSAREETMSQSQLPPKNPRNPHRATRVPLMMTGPCFLRPRNLLL
jgi:hypothetical protein